jgi:hypothetical protein
MIPRRSAQFIFGRLALGVTSISLIASVMFGAKETPAQTLAAVGVDANAVDDAVLADVKSFAADNDETLTSLKLSATPGNPLEAAAGSTASNCPAGMIDVEGDYCPWVEQKCLRWLDPDTKMRCAEFAPTSECLTKTVKKHVCMDKYEYPNRVGVDPVVMKTWYEARATCASEGKRLCTESEWTLACEGEERLPYPYGYARSSEACNIDKPHPDVDEKALANAATRIQEAERLWQGEPSGSREACVSPFGVHDMTGNVDEWVVNESGKPYKSALKGGYWGPVKTRCRPSTIAHAEDFSFYQIGFRCCSDPGAPASSNTGAGAGSGTGPSSHINTMNPAPTSAVQSGSSNALLAGS